MNCRHKIVVIILTVSLFFAENNLSAAVRRMLGPEVTMAWASSYLAIESASLKINNDSTWSYATSAGWFFDLLLTPYVSIRTDWFFYPALLNGRLSTWGSSPGIISMHEMGFSVNRHFNYKSLNPWFGVGPYLQFSTPGNVNTYIIHVLLSLGFDYEMDNNVFFCPWIMTGLGMRLIKSDQNSVVIDVPTGKDFSTSGIVIFLKIGFARSF